MKNISLSILLFFCCSILFGQHSVFDQMKAIQSEGFRAVTYDFLPPESADLHARYKDLPGIRKGIVLSLDRTIIESLYRGNNDFIRVPVQLSEKATVFLLLKKQEICTQDFLLYAASDRTHPIPYQPGLHYKGIIEGDPNSLVGLSVYRNQIMAFISDRHGNSEIKLIPGDKDKRHVIFNVEDQDQPFAFECNGPDDEVEYTADQLFQSPGSRDLNDCVRLYIEIDDELVTAKGGAIPATDFMLGILNQSIVVFANEGINMVVSEMLAWDVSSPYSVTNATFMMNSFVDNTGFYNGDLAMLVNYTDFTGHSYGSLAGLCNPNPDLSKCAGPFNQTSEFSNVVTTCHYFGHLLGSKHTHDCVWNGNNTSIDGCFYEGGITPCPGPDPGYPVNGGTMMSYCSPGHGWFYNLAEGFGPQPGNIIRNTVNQAGNCILPCGPPSLYCFSNGANAASKFIKKVVLGSITNESGLNYGYGNYISLSTNLNTGTAYSISLSPGHAAQTKYWRVWIDYNHDQDWADPGEQVGQGSGSGSGAINLNFTIPPTSPAVSTRMRVSMSYGTFPAVCGVFNEGEVEDYTVNIIGAGPTCTDGIQNQGESGIDCGGPCPACPPLPSCTDGIQNQGETGIDCGGPCPLCPASDSTVLLASYFETGLDSWIDGGPDMNRVQTTNSWEGQYSIELADNSAAQSAMTSPTFNLSTAVGLKISFHFYAVSMETGEDFWVQYKNGSGNWVTIGTFVSGTHFNNNVFYSSTITVPNFTPTSSGSLRIQCDASDNNDNVYIDAVIITRLNTNAAGQPVQNMSVVGNSSILAAHQDNEELSVYPNPVRDVLHISYSGDIQSIRLLNVNGQQITVSEESIADKQINTESLAPGLYFLWVESAGEWHPARFSKM